MESGSEEVEVSVGIGIPFFQSMYFAQTKNAFQAVCANNVVESLVVEPM
jgi:hypothetical protein|tara:strand:- start:466 stop:612 length:147 start_codon:yes stop_codon:yes gene_type:complete